MNIELRKLQRLGSKSLVVTLPRSWVKKHNLKPGDMAYVMEEFDKIIIIPSKRNPETETESMVDIDKLMDEEGENPINVCREVVSCMYILGIDNYVLKTKNIPPEQLFDVLRKLGVSTASMDVDPSNEGVRVTNIIDISRLDPALAVRNLGRIIIRLTDILIRYLKGIEEQQSVLEKINDIGVDALNLERLVMRSLIGPKGIEDNAYLKEAYSLFSASVLLVLVQDYIANDIKWMIEHNKKPSNSVIEYFERSKDFINTTIMIVINPSTKRTKELFQKLALFDKEINNAIKGTTSINARMLTTLTHIVRILRVIGHISFCLGLQKSRFFFKEK